MQFVDAIKALVGAPHLRAFRIGGPVLIMTDRQRINDIRGGRGHQYVGKFSDYCAIDWQVMTTEQFAAFIIKLREQRTGA